MSLSTQIYETMAAKLQAQATAFAQKSDHANTAKARTACAARARELGRYFDIFSRLASRDKSRKQ